MPAQQAKPNLWEDPEYKKLNTKEREEVLQGLFTKRKVAEDPGYQALSVKEQQEARQELFKKWDPGYVPINEPEGPAGKGLLERASDWAGKLKERYTTKPAWQFPVDVASGVGGSFLEGLNTAAGLAAEGVHLATKGWVPSYMDSEYYKKVKEFTAPRNPGEDIGAALEVGAEMLVGEGAAVRGMRAAAELGGRVLPKFASTMIRVAGESGAAAASTGLHGGTPGEIGAAAAMSPLFRVGSAAFEHKARNMMTVVAKGHGWLHEMFSKWRAKTAGTDLAFGRGQLALEELYERNPSFWTLRGLTQEIKRIRGDIDSQVRKRVVAADVTGKKIMLDDPVHQLVSTIPGTKTSVELLPEISDLFPGKTTPVGFISALKAWRQGKLPSMTSGFDKAKRDAIIQQVDDWITLFEQQPTGWIFPSNLQSFKKSIGDSTVFNGGWIKDPADRFLNDIRKRLYRYSDDMLDRMDPELAILNDKSSGLRTLMEEFGSRAEAGGMFLKPLRVAASFTKGGLAGGAYALASGAGWGSLGPAAAGGAALAAAASTPSRVLRMKGYRLASKAVPYGRVPAQTVPSAMDDPYGVR